MLNNRTSTKRSTHSCKKASHTRGRPSSLSFLHWQVFEFLIRYPEAMAEKKVTGPASYFPSIEKKYGQPIEYWMKQLKQVSAKAHMEQVAFLKEKFGMGHGHANALVAVFRKENGL